MDCVVNKSKILDKETIDEILKDHEGYFIEGMNFNDQRSIVKHIASLVHREAIQNKKVDTATIKKNIVDSITKESQSLKSLITIKKMLNTFDSVQTINAAEQTLNKYNAILNNLDTLFLHAKDFLSVLDGVVITNNSNETIAELFSDIDEEVTEGGLERTTFSDNFYFELDTKHTASADLKKFLAFIPKYEYNKEGIKEPIETLIGTQEFFEFEHVYNELHRLLVGSKPSEQEMIATLQTAANEADISKNNAQAWIGEFVKYFATAKSHTKKEFISEMAKHKIDMQFVMWSRKWNEENKRYDYTLKLYNDNSGSIANRLLSIWRKEFLTTNLAKDEVYNKTEISLILSRLTELKDKKLPKQEVAKGIHNLLTSMGVLVNSRYLASLYTNNKEFKFGNSRVYPSSFVEILEKLVNSMPENKPIESYDFIGESFIKALAAGSAGFEKEEFSNSFRIGDKVIYTYSINQYLVNRFRDLLDDKTLRDKLSKSIFSESSLYLSLLENDNSGLKEWFDLGYVSLNPLKKNKGKRSNKITDISELDHEVTKVGYFNSISNYRQMKLNGKTYQMRKAQYFFPTNSDKSRVMSVKGVAFDSTTRVLDKNTNKVETVFTEEAIDLFYNSVVLPEINRIHDTDSKEFKEAVNLATYNGGLFYLTPSLNANTELINAIKANNNLSTEHVKFIRNEIKSILNKEVADKLATWTELGINDNNNVKYISTVENSPAIDANAKSKADNKNYKNLKETAMDMVFNYAIFNTNMFQLVIGDTAQYFKSKSADSFKQVSDTYDNIGKRLAAEIAPRIEMEGDNYLQIFVKDVELESVSSEYLKELFKDRPEAYKKYQEINAADAQEYTTWREHLNILKYLGRITDEEYSEAEVAFKEERNPSKEVFDKVLQPLKPLYVNNEVVSIGERYIDKKTYIKSSSFPLIPTLTKGLQLNKLRLAMEALETKSKKGVRLAYKSAVKVGFISSALELTDKQGNLVDEINLEGTYKELQRSGFGIQQDIPYDETKSVVNKGSQESKLLWANFTHDSLYNEYTELYKQLYVHGKNKLDNRLKGKDGKISNKQLSKILTKELKRKGETNKPLYDGLKLNNTDDFITPLWISPYADAYASLISSIVKNNIISHKLPGKSYVLGSNVGMKPEIKEGTEGQQVIEDFKSDIVFTESYDPTKGLQIQREENGKILGSQVLVPFRFRNNKGELLDVKNFITEGKLDLNRLPKELLEMFGFRIPTQLHASMSYIEVVGFLPETMGDLIIAPAEFTTQMGSDFDVDKLYTYMFSTNYDPSTKTLSKKPLVIDYQQKTKELSKELSILKEKLIEEGIDVVNLNADIDSIIEKEGIVALTTYQLKEEIKILYPNLKSTQYIDLYLAKETLDNNYTGGIHNRLLEIHLEVMKDKRLQESIHAPLGMGLHTEVIKKLDSIKEKQGYTQSLVFDEYQKRKFYDGTAGKSGVGMFSIDSIFNVLAQNKGLTLTEIKISDEGKSYRTNVNVRFGDKESNGDLSGIYTLGKNSKRFKTDVIAASQNLAVDNANEQGMHKINMNQHTFSVYSILNFLGFEEDISDLFMSQPIILEYVKGMRNNASILKEYNANAENDLVDSLIEKYGKTEYDTEKHNRLADFTGMNASNKMFELIRDGITADKFGLYQAAILEKFMYLKSIEKPLSEIKQLLNIDSKGFHRNMYINRKRLDSLYDMENSLVLNASNLFGNYIETDNNLYIEPTTTAGFDNIFGTKNLIDNFGSYFLESNKVLKFDEIIRKLTDITGKTYKSDKKLYEVKEAYKAYLLSNINVDNVDDLRKELFLSQSKDSLYKRLLRLKKTKYGRDNRFINNIDVNFVKSLEVDFNNSGGDSFDQTLLYKSFIDLFRDSKDRDGIVLSDIAEELVLYSILRGGDKAQQFVKFIPVSVMNKLINIPKNNFDTDVFIDQYIKHNLDEATLVDEYERVNPKTVKLVSPRGRFIRIENKKNDVRLYKQSEVNKDTYILTDTLGVNGTDEYTPYVKSDSIFSINRVNEQNIKGTNNPLMDKEVFTKELISEPVSTEETTFDKLNFSTSTSLIESIVDLKDEYPTEAKIAEALLPFVDKSMKINVVQEGNSNYDTETNEINIAKVEENNRDTLITVLHETLHSLSSGLIKKFENNEELSPVIREALVRLNGFKNQIIDKLSPEQRHRLEWVFAKYAMDWSKTPGRLEYILAKKTLHPTVRSIIARVQEFTNNIPESTDTDLHALLAEELNINTIERKLYYSLFNLDEFISIAGSFDKVRDDLMRLSGNTYIDKIKTFFKQLLDYLGIKNEETQKFLDDIFTVVSKDKIIQEIQPIQQTKIDTSNTFTFNNNVTIDTGNIVVNSQQKQALDKLATFYEDGTKTFALKGYAGTGKTTILRLFQEYINQQNDKLRDEGKYSKLQHLRFTSPTHRANAVIKQNTGAKVYTLHSLFGLSPDMDLEEFDVRKAKYSKNNTEKLTSGDLLVIDESSMINDSLYTFIKEGAEKLGVKVLFVGDPKQLKPVKQTSLSKAFSAVDNTYELTEVMRTGDTPLLTEITDIRKDKNFSYESKVSNQGGIVYTSNRKDFVIEALKLFKSSKLKTNPFLVRILSGTNEKVKELNKVIREYIYGSKVTNQYNEGELLVGFDNFSKDINTNDSLIVNSGDYKVIEASEEYDTDILGIPVRKINLTVEDLFERELRYKIKKLSILSKNTSKETLDKLGNKFEELRQYAIVESAKGNKKAWLPFYSFKNNLATPVDIQYKDKTVIKKTLDYGYAMTIHKSQGGTYDNVFIDADSIDVFPDKEQRQQLKYVALSRASKLAVILSNNAKQEDIDKTISQIDNTDSTTAIEEDMYLTELEEQGKELIEKCKGSAPIAKNGMRTNLSKGHRWSIVKDLKGATHEQGGIDLSITNGKVHFTSGKNLVHAKHGMKIPKRVTESLDETKKSDTFTKGLEWYSTEMKCGGYAERGAIIPRKKKDVEPLNSNSWSIIADLKGKSHAQGGINLDITDGKVHFIRGKSKIHARCGCQIRSTSKVTMETVKTNKQKFGRK